MYAPSNDNLEFFCNLANMANEIDCPNKIIGGDLNLCFDLDKYKRDTMSNNHRSLKTLQTYVDENYMIDVWRVKNPDLFRFTWKRHSPNIVLSRLDYFLTTSKILSWVDNVDIVPGFRSHHSVIVIDFQPSTIERG